MERGMPRIGVIEIGGTRVQISTGDLGLEAIAELAAGLVPAPEEPPAVG
jgi:predicted NBD/HSP70 family sugar kinase